MFDFGWSEVLLIAVVALIVVGPKELPALLRTVGRYVGIVRAQALAFRAQVDDVIKDTELETLRDEMTELRDGVKGAMREGKQGMASELQDAKSAMGTIDADVSALAKPTASADRPVTPGASSSGEKGMAGKNTARAGGDDKRSQSDEGEA